MIGLIILRSIGVTCLLTVLSQHIQIPAWEGCLLGFGVMMVLGTLFDVERS